MIVIDATAAVNGLLRGGASRERMASGELHVPHLADSEVLSTLTRLVREKQVDPDVAKGALDGWAALGVHRHPAWGLLPRMWAMRDNVKAYDATYVALAELLGLPLVTCDKRLGRAPGIGCEIVVLDD